MIFEVKIFMILLRNYNCFGFQMVAIQFLNTDYKFFSINKGWINRVLSDKAAMFKGSRLGYEDLVIASGMALSPTDELRSGSLNQT